MKKGKKFTLVAGVSILLAALVVGISVFLLYDNYVAETVISLEDQTAMAGDNISVPIKIERNHGLYKGLVVVKYDAAALEFLSIANGDVFEACTANGLETPGEVVILVEQMGVENTLKDGNIATINFKVKTTAVKGEHPISIYKPEVVEEGTYFIRYQDIDAEKWTVTDCEDAIITVK